MNIQSVREKLGRKFASVSEVSAGVLRGIRRNGQRDVAAYVFDLNNRLPETVGDLSNYLDEVMGPAYFDKDASPDLRWNNYLYFVVDKIVSGNRSFQAARRNLEADRNYARKFVVAEDEFDRVLDELDSVAVVDKGIAAADVVQAWSEGLSAIGLEDVLDGERPIADVVRSISSGTAKQSVRTKKTTGAESSQLLADSHLASVNLSRFRPYPKQKSFDGFGRANLLFGSNGAGKTSLLEGLEFLYCGANRRSGASISAAVEGLLVNGHPAKTSAQQPLTDFKTRQRMWYGGDDNSRQNKLPNQFARFNFLNTDAAAELSLLKNDTIEGNAESLAALLSGHEATLMWRRIQDVRKAVAEEVRSKRSERAVAESEHKAREHERLVLEAAPGQSDAAFSVFTKDLERIGWRVCPSSKEEVTEKLAESLSDLTSQLSTVQKVDWLSGPVTANTIAQEAAALQRACEGVNIKIPAARDDERIRSVLVQRQSLAQSRLIALTAISPSALSELNIFSSALKQANDELALSARVFAALPSDDPPEGWDSSLGIKSILVAKSESTAIFRDITSQIKECEQRQEAMASNRSQLQRAMAELQGWAQKVIEHRHSDTNCPVCGTEFVPGELLQRMRALSLTPSDNEISELRLRIERLASDRNRIGGELSWLEQLEKFTRTLPKTVTAVTVHDAQRAVSDSVERQLALLRARQTAEQGLSGYARAGLSLDAIERLCLPVDGDEQPRLVSLDVLEAQGRAKKYLQHLQIAIDELDKRVLQRNEELHQLLEAVEIKVGDSLEVAIQQLFVRQRIAQRANEVCASARRVLDLAPTADIISLLTALESAVLGAKKVIAALQADSSSTTRLTTLRAQLGQLSDRLSRVGAAIDRLAAAQRVLDDIIENQSLDAASAAVVAATHKVADSIFARIHAPSEYMVTEEAGAPLRRREGNSPVQLNQVSTGQRAAYALSMFLAMNAQVKAGPKVILLDDPISHVDDLNALSFLDYLRNLVLKSDRQVFFATADEKVAGLFLHKFAFLGNDFRTIELARG